MGPVTWSSTTFKKALEKWEEKDGPKSRASLQLTPKELKEEIGQELHRYLLVGWVSQKKQQANEQPDEQANERTKLIRIEAEVDQTPKRSFAFARGLTI